MSASKANNRNGALDFLRVVAALFVVTGHVSSDYLFRYPAGNAQWNIAVIYDFLAHMLVPFFFMISGSFLLDPERELPGKKLLTKIGRLAFALLFWSLIYLIIGLIRARADLTYIRQNLGWLLQRLIAGEVHLWFLWALIGLYLVAPILRQIVRCETAAIWFIILFFAVQVLLPLLIELPKVGYLFSTVRDSMKINLVLGYVGYFVLGYIIKVHQVKKGIVLCALGVAAVCFIPGVLMTIRRSTIAGEPQLELMEYMHPCMIVPSVTVFLAATELLQRHPSFGQGKLIRFLSAHSFGIYLSHMLILKVLQAYDLVVWPVGIIMIPVVTLVVFAAAAFIAWLLRMIPWLGKRIV